MSSDEEAENPVHVFVAQESKALFVQSSRGSWETEE